MIEVCFCTDRLFLPHLMVSIKSLLSNASNVKPLRIHIISNISEINHICPDTGNFKFEIIIHTINNTILEHLPFYGYFSLANYYRLLIPRLIDASRLIYLDCDTIILSDLGELWDTDLYKFPLGAVEDPYCAAPVYDGLEFNSGVMLLDLEVIRSERLFDQAIEQARKNINLSLVDQSLLNRVFRARWSPLHPSWNCQTLWDYKASWNRQYDDFCCSVEPTTFSFAEMVSATRHPKIVHFTGPDKPWNFLLTHRFKSLYWYYRGEPKPRFTGYPDFTFRKLATKMANILLPWQVNRLRRGLQK